MNIRCWTPQALFLIVLAALAPACGGGGGGGGGGGVNPKGPLNLNGGDVTGSNPAVAIGGTGTQVSGVYSRGQIRIGVDAAPLAPTPPAPPNPATGIVLDTADLAGGTVSMSGNLFVTGTAVTPAGGACNITSTDGDIVISGTLLSGDGPGNAAAISLSAPLGTVYVTGTLRTINTDGVADGDDGGSVIITAGCIVITGTIATTGEAGGGAVGTIFLTANTSGVPSPDIFLVNATLAVAGADHSAGTGSAGGTIAINADDEVFWFGGTMTGHGGQGTLQGGSGSFVLIYAPTLVSVASTLDMRGGDAVSSGNASGGMGGTLAINGDQGNTDTVQLFGIVDMNGGNARGGSGGAIGGGTGGNLQIGASSGAGTPGAPLTVSLVGGITSIGGVASVHSDTGSIGGQGGMLNFINDYAVAGSIQMNGAINASGGPGEFGGAGESFDPGVVLKLITGDITVGGSILLSGGDGKEMGGEGGRLQVAIGTGGTTTSGNFTLSGTIVCDGGSSQTGLNNGGDGGRVEVALLDNTAGASALAQANFQAGSVVDVSGGDDASFGFGGFGGVVKVTAKGNVTLAGTINAQGGSSGSFDGGEGGNLEVDTDLGGGTAASITVAATGIIQVSGGSGDQAGSARNNGVLGVTDNVSDLAVRFDAGIAGGAVVNNGAIFAQGPAVGGRGGDILFIGAGPPLPGTQNRTGNGGAGDFSAQ